MKRLELYTVEDLKRDLDRGLSDTEIALKKWSKIVECIRALEEVSVQVTSFCLRHQGSGCKTCPILNYDYPCGHPYATFTIFYQELRKLRTLAESLLAILATIDEQDKESKKDFV